MVLCDAVGYGPDGKKTLYGLFHRVAARDFPCTHPSMCVATRWSYGDGKYRMQIRITDSDHAVVFEPTDPCEIVLTIQNLQFKRPGTYWVQAILDGEPLDEETAIFIEKVPPEQ
jgi:hypothetical protein